MAHMYKSILDIGVQQGQWTSKVIVAKKNFPKKSRLTRSTYQNFVFIDLQGNKVHCTIYNNDITAFQNTLVWSNTYLISNALVKFTDPRNKPTLGPTQWTINGRTKVQLVEEDNRNLLFLTYNFVLFRDLQQHMDMDSEIDIVAVVIDVLPKKIVQTKFQTESCIQELVLMNEKFETTVLTAWDEFVVNQCTAISAILTTSPVILATNLRVSSFNGLGLCTKSKTSIYINPPFKQLTLLHSWVDDSIEILETIRSKKSYLTSTSKSIAYPPAEMIVLIKDVPRLLTEKDQLFVWIRANIRVINNNQPFWCMCCNLCNKMSNVGFGKVYQCIYCKYNCAKGTPRAIVHVQLQDSTGYMNATMIGDAAELFLQCPGENLMQIQRSGNEDLLNHIRTSTTEEHVLYVKAINNSRRCTRLKYDIIFMLNPILSTITCSSPTNKTSSSVMLQTVNKDCADINKKADEQLDLTILSLEASNPSKQAEKHIGYKIFKDIGFHEAPDLFLHPAIVGHSTAHF